MTETFSPDGERLTDDEQATCRQLAPQAKRFAKVTRTVEDGTTFVLLFRNPTRAEYKNFRATWGVDGKELEAFEVLALTVCVKPTQAELYAILEDWPGLINGEVCGPLAKLAGMTSGDSAKK